MQKLVAITGAAGFIGSRTLEWFALRRPDCSLIAVDHPIEAAKTANLAVAPTVPFLTHKIFLDRLTKDEIQPDLIVHFGACSSTTETSWDYLFENNLHYSQSLWNWCADRNKRLIYASSAATYGDGTRGFDDESPIIQLVPLNLYAKSKHEFDLWIETKKETDERVPKQSVGLKFFNVFGPGESHKGRMASMVFHGWNQIRQKGRVSLFQSHRPDYPDGGQLRDFISVGDIVRVVDALEKKPEVSGLFNLGTGKAESFRTLIEAVFCSLNREPEIDFIPMPEDLKGKYQYFTEATMLKLARNGVQYNPTPLVQAIQRYVNWLEKAH